MTGSLGWAASTYKVLHAFSGKPDGGGLYDRLAIDAKGNLYGTTWGGGAYGEGTVFKLTPVGRRNWTETILHSFCPDWPQCSDGALPSSGLTFDASGNLYGTTLWEVFQVTPGPVGWDLNVIYNFGGPDLTADSAGNRAGQVQWGRRSQAETTST